MNREFLFRGKRVDNGEWIEGNLLHDPDLDTFSIVGFDYYNGDNGLEREEFCYSVDPATVGQYTDLTDKNGVKIFEGDIVRGNIFGDEWRGAVVWIDRIAGFGVRYSHRSEPTAWENSSMLKQLMKYRIDEFSAEVIGNIHDNPGLLEVQK